MNWWIPFVIPSKPYFSTSWVTESLLAYICKSIKVNFLKSLLGFKKSYLNSNIVLLLLVVTSVLPLLQCGNVIAITNASKLVLSQPLSLPSPVNPTVSIVAVDTAAKTHCLVWHCCKLIATVTDRAELLQLPLLVTVTIFGNIIVQNDLTMSVAMCTSAAMILIWFYSYLLQS